jgi:hypothetical protein
MKDKCKRVLAVLLIVAVVTSLTACAKKSAVPQESQTQASQPVSEPSPERATYAPMNIFSDEFSPCGADWPENCTVFEASFDKSATEGKSRFILSMTGSGDMFACVAYQADIAGLSEDEKNARINEYLKDGYCHIDGKDGRWVDIKRADPNDDRYEYVEADGSHGQDGAGCVIDISCFIDGIDDSYVEKYMQLVRDNYSLDALAAVAEHMDVKTDFSECGIYVNLYKNVVKTSVVYHVSDVEAVRKSIAENLQSDWWEWNGNQETWIQYDDIIGNKLIFDTAGGAVTVSQESKLYGPDSGEGSFSALGFTFNDAGTCGVYEEHEPFYSSVAVARPEWGEYSEDWNMSFNDSNVNGYGVVMWYYADEDRYEIQIEKDNVISKYTYFTKGALEWCYPDTDTVRQIFNAAFGTEGDEFYHAPYERFQQYAQERFRMSVEELYALPAN